MGCHHAYHFVSIDIYKLPVAWQVLIRQRITNPPLWIPTIKSDLMAIGKSQAATNSCNVIMMGGDGDCFVTVID